ncbi:MAG: hypothetical protein ABR969_04295 [Sedimentisphaerales bacterium]|jgi:hypothetical protein
MDREKSSDQTKCSGLIGAKPAIKFLCLFVLIYGLLMTAWPAVGDVYSKFYRAGGKFLFGSFGRGGIVRFSQPEDSKDDICIDAFNRYHVDKNGKISGAQFRYNIRYSDYMHIAFLTALIAATPLPLRRRGWAIVWGLILMQVFVVFKVIFIVLELFSRKLVSLLILNSFWKTVVVTTNQILVRDLTTGFIIAFFIWVLVSFRREDWQRLRCREEIWEHHTEEKGM